MSRAYAARHWDDHTPAQAAEVAGKPEHKPAWTDLDLPQAGPASVTSSPAPTPPSAKRYPNTPPNPSASAPSALSKSYEAYAGLSFHLRKMQDDTRRAFEPPNPPAPADWPDRIYTWLGPHHPRYGRPLPSRLRRTRLLARGHTGREPPGDPPPRHDQGRAQVLHRQRAQGRLSLRTRVGHHSRLLGRLALQPRTWLGNKARRSLQRIRLLHHRRQPRSPRRRQPRPFLTHSLLLAFPPSGTIPPPARIEPGLISRPAPNSRRIHAFRLIRRHAPQPVPWHDRADHPESPPLRLRRHL